MNEELIMVVLDNLVDENLELRRVISDLDKKLDALIKILLDEGGRNDIGRD